MFNLLKKHYLIIILAFVVGSLTCFPQILAIKEVENFQGIYKTVNNDETYYMARAKDIIDGHSFLANPYIYEYKGGYPVQFWLPDYILAKPLALLNIDLHHGYLFYDFLLPFVLVILSYSIIYLLTGSIFLSFLGAAFLHLNLFLYSFNRNPSPQFNFIFWLLLFLFWLRFLKKPTLFYAIAIGVSFGLLFHIYTYYWTFYVVFFAIFLFLNFVLKRPLPHKKYLLAFYTALIISIPYFFFWIKSMSLPYYAETLARIGMIDTHFPSGRKILMWGCVILLLFYISYKKRIVPINSNSLLILSGILAPMIVVNQHIITGKNLQFSSHYWMLSVFCFIFAFAYLLNLWLNKIKIRYLKIVLLILISGYVFYRPVVYINAVVERKAVTYSEVEIEQQRYAPVFAWLNKNTLLDEVVYAYGGLSTLIPIYTANNVFAGGSLHFMPDGEIYDRYLLNNYWEDFDEEKLRNSQTLRGAYYITKYNHDLSKNKIRKLFFLPPEKYIEIPEEKINDFLELARNMKEKNFEQQLKKYKVDYFIWDKKVNNSWPIEELTFLQFLYEVNDMVIYKVK